MNQDSLPPPIWVDRPAHFERVIGDIAGQPRIAVDTESNSLHAYRERVCLMQFSTPKADYVVDPLALENIPLLAPVFRDRGIEKIFHAAEYDLICLGRDYDFTFGNIFDTMQAARVLGYTQVGLDNLLAEKFGVRMDKRHQKADWAARPLSAAQIDYARLDTHYLIPLRDLLETELREKGRLELAREDFARTAGVEAPREKLNGASWKRFASRKDVSARELTILSELCAVRDQIAERMDRPPFKVVSDRMLLEIARNLPEKDVDLAGVGLSPKQIRLWGSDILAAARKGAVAPFVERERAQRPDDATLKRLDRLKSWRKTRAKEMGVESDVVLPRVYMYSLAERPPGSMQDLELRMADTPWRIQQYGEQLLKLVGRPDAA